MAHDAVNDWENRQEYIPTANFGGSSLGRQRASSAVATKRPSSARNVEPPRSAQPSGWTSRPVTTMAAMGRNGRAQRSQSAATVAGRSTVLALGAKYAWEQAEGAQVPAEHRVHAQAMARNKRPEALAENVVALKEELHKTRQEQTQILTEKRRLEEELFRAKANLVKADELLNNRERALSPTMGLSTLYRTPGTTDLIDNLRDQYRQMRAARDQLAAAFKALQQSIRATRVAELQAEVNMYGEELGRVQRINQVMKEKMEMAQAAAADANARAHDAQKQFKDFLGAGSEGTPIQLAAGNTLSAARLRKTMLVMHQAHRALHSQAQALRSWFPGGLSMEEFAHRASQRPTSTGGAYDILRFLRSHQDKMASELAFQPGNKPLELGSQAPPSRPSSAKGPLRPSPPPTQALLRESAVDPAAALSTMAALTRDVRIRGAEKASIDPNYEMALESLRDLMKQLIAEVDGIVPASSSSEALADLVDQVSAHLRTLRGMNLNVATADPNVTDNVDQLADLMQLSLQEVHRLQGCHAPSPQGGNEGDVQSQVNPLYSSEPPKSSVTNTPGSLSVVSSLQQQPVSHSRSDIPIAATPVASNYSLDGFVEDEAEQASIISLERAASTVSSRASSRNTQDAHESVVASMHDVSVLSPSMPGSHISELQSVARSATPTPPSKPPSTRSVSRVSSVSRRSAVGPGLTSSTVNGMTGDGGMPTATLEDSLVEEQAEDDDTMASAAAAAAAVEVLEDEEIEESKEGEQGEQGEREDEAHVEKGRQEGGEDREADETSNVVHSLADSCITDAPADPVHSTGTWDERAAASELAASVVVSTAASAANGQVGASQMAPDGSSQAGQSVTRSTPSPTPSGAQSASVSRTSLHHSASMQEDTAPVQPSMPSATHAGAWPALTGGSAIEPSAGSVTSVGRPASAGGTSATASKHSTVSEASVTSAQHSLAEDMRSTPGGGASKLSDALSAAPQVSCLNMSDAATQNVGASRGSEAHTADDNESAVVADEAAEPLEAVGADKGREDVSDVMAASASLTPTSQAPPFDDNRGDHEYLPSRDDINKTDNGQASLENEDSGGAQESQVSLGNEDNLDDDEEVSFEDEDNGDQEDDDNDNNEVKQEEGGVVDAKVEAEAEAEGGEEEDEADDNNRSRPSTEV